MSHKLKSNFITEVLLQDRSSEPYVRSWSGGSASGRGLQSIWLWKPLELDLSNSTGLVGNRNVTLWMVNIRSTQLLLMWTWAKPTFWSWRLSWEEGGCGSLQDKHTGGRHSGKCSLVWAVQNCHFDITPTPGPSQQPKRLSKGNLRCKTVQQGGNTCPHHNRLFLGTRAQPSLNTVLTTSGPGTRSKKNYNLGAYSGPHKHRKLGKNEMAVKYVPEEGNNIKPQNWVKWMEIGNLPGK